MKGPALLPSLDHMLFFLLGHNRSLLEGVEIVLKQVQFYVRGITFLLQILNFIVSDLLALLN